MKMDVDDDDSDNDDQNAGFDERDVKFSDDDGMCYNLISPTQLIYYISKHNK